MSRALLFCAILTLGTPLSRADDDTPHNIYHSLKRFFTGSDGHHSSPAPSHHRNAKRASTRATAQGSPEASPSTTPEATVLPESSPAHTGAGEAALAPSSTPSPPYSGTPAPSPARSAADSRVMVLPAASPLLPDATPAPSGSPAPNSAVSTNGQGRP